MTRRFFLTIGTLFILALTGVLFMKSYLRDKIIGKLRYFFTPTSELKPRQNREIVVLPAEGNSVSVELALNSRCNSDYTDNQKYLHWGMFDKYQKLSDQHIQRIIALSKIPSYTHKKTAITAEQNIITFLIENLPEGLQRDWLMVENGMQQQAMGLVCAALGVGLKFKNMGISGRLLPDNNFGTVRMLLDPMKPSYNDSFWSEQHPFDSQPSSQDDLPLPTRKGHIPLISALADLQIEKEAAGASTKQDIGQLLWAARGRTPHLYKSNPWGMTIPFWTDKIDISKVYLIYDFKLFKYLNWRNGAAAHALSEISSVDQLTYNHLLEYFPNKHNFIILDRFDKHARAYWEIGYQLLNLLLQAHTLKISYSSALLDLNQKSLFNNLQVNDPVAILAV